jgi:hypothetical protein
VLLGDLIQGVAADTGQLKTVVEAIMRGVLARIEGGVGKRETGESRPLRPLQDL